MFKFNEIKELIKLIDKSTVEEFEVENEGTRVYIRKPGAGKPAEDAQPVIHTNYVPMPAGPVSEPSSQPAAAAQPGISSSSQQATEQAADPSLHYITSPMVGTFYAAPSPDAAAYVKIGDKVDENSVVCIVEAMKLMNEIEAEVKGVIVDMLVENGQLVEFGQPLFSVKLDS